MIPPSSLSLCCCCCLRLSLKTASFFLSLSAFGRLSLPAALYKSPSLSIYNEWSLEKTRARERRRRRRPQRQVLFVLLLLLLLFEAAQSACALSLFFFSYARASKDVSSSSSSSSSLDRVFRVYFFSKIFRVSTKISLFFFFLFFSLSRHREKKTPKKIIEERRAFASKEDHSGTFTSRESERARERQPKRIDEIFVCGERRFCCLFFFLFQGERRARSVFG